LAFEAAECFTAALALRLLALQVGPRRSLDATLRHGDAVESAVQLPVASAVEAVTALLARARLERSDAGRASEPGVVCEALDRADLASAAWPR
jgi:hypothetical protein